MKKLLYTSLLLAAGILAPLAGRSQQKQLVFADGFEGSQTYFQQQGVQGCGQWGLASDNAAEGSQYMAYAASLLSPGCYADMYAGPIKMQSPGPKDSLEFTFAMNRKLQKGDETLYVMWVDGNGKKQGKTLAILSYYYGQPSESKTGWYYYTTKINCQALGTGTDVPFYIFLRGSTETRPKNFISIDATQLYYIDYEDGGSSSIEIQQKGTEQGPQVSLYPNPAASGNFSIRFEEALQSQAVLQITDMQGRTLYSERITAQGAAFTHQLQLEGILSKGMYAVSISTATGITRKLLVVSE